MEVGVREAKARFSELARAARNGERVTITVDGRPTVELVRCDRRGGIDFARLEVARRAIGLAGDRERWSEELDDPSFSPRVLGLADGDEE